MKKIITMIIVITLGITALFFEKSVLAKQKPGLNQTSLVIAAGKSRQLTLQGINSKKAGKILWKSSDKRILSVNKTGKITAKKNGDIHYNVYVPDSYDGT